MLDFGGETLKLLGFGAEGASEDGAHAALEGLEEKHQYKNQNTLRSDGRKVGFQPHARAARKGEIEHGEKSGGDCEHEVTLDSEGEKTISQDVVAEERAGNKQSPIECRPPKPQGR